MICTIGRPTIQTQLSNFTIKYVDLYKLHNFLALSLYIMHILKQVDLCYTLTIVNDTYLLSWALCPLWAFLAHLAHSMRTSQLHQTDCQRWQPLTTIIRRVERVQRNLPYLEYFLYTGRVTETTGQTLLGGNEAYRLKTVRCAESSDLNIKENILAETSATKISGCFYYLYEALQTAPWQVYRKEQLNIQRKRETT